MKFLDFFSGIGGFRSGFEQAGMECVGYCEFDKFARLSYQAMYDTSNEWTATDVREVHGNDLPKADIWTFGFPCQDISIAGKQKGLHEGQRSRLFFEIMRLLDEAKENKPQWIIAENVKNLLSIDKGWGFYSVLAEMGKRGFSVEWRVYNSKAYSVPQNRERVFVVGYFGDAGGRQLLPTTRESERTIDQAGQLLNTTNYGGNPQIGRVYRTSGLAPTLSTCQGGQQEPKILVPNQSFIDLNVNPKITDTARCLIARYSVGITNQKGTNSGVIVLGQLYNNYTTRVHDPNGISSTLMARDYKGPKLIAEYGKISSIKACLTPDRLSKHQNGRRFKCDGEPMFTLTRGDLHGVLIVDHNINSLTLSPSPLPKQPINTVSIRNSTKEGYLHAKIGDGIDLSFPNSTSRRGRVQSQATNTVTCGSTLGVLLETYPNTRIRKLTPKECWRLQGFSDEQFDKAAAVNSKSQLYKQAGNAVTVTVAREIGEHIMWFVKNT